MGSEAVVCAPHGRPTHVRCAGCDAPICPRCYVRTPVSIKCATCADVRVSTVGARARRYAVPALAVLAVVGMAAFLSSAFIQGKRDPAAEEPRGPNEAEVGQEVQEGGLGFLVKGIECQGKELAGVSTRALGRFCVLRVRVRNVGAQAMTYSNGIQVLVDQQGRRYDVAQAATQMVSSPAPAAGADRSTSVQQMNPGTELERVLAFDVPEGVTPAVAEFHSRPRSIGARVRLPQPGR